MEKFEESLRYKEKKSDLAVRIDAHDKYSEKNIDDWIIGLLNLKEDENILDVGCGGGKQLISYFSVVKNGRIFGCDISNELLDMAREKVGEQNSITFFQHDMNQKFSFDDNLFDVLTACFSIYYVEDSRAIIKEFSRILKQEGRLLIVGPTPKNTEDFWQLHEKVTGREVDEKALYRRARIHDEFIPLMKNYFQNCRVSIFNNTLRFESAAELIDYYTASPIFKEISNGVDKEEIVRKMKEEVDKVIKKKGHYPIKKEVYGVLASRKVVN